MLKSLCHACVESIWLSNHHQFQFINKQKKKNTLSSSCFFFFSFSGIKHEFFEINETFKRWTWKWGVCSGTRLLWSVCDISFLCRIFVRWGRNWMCCIWVYWQLKILQEIIANLSLMDHPMESSGEEVTGFYLSHFYWLAASYTINDYICVILAYVTARRKKKWLFFFSFFLSCKEHCGRES